MVVFSVSFIRNLNGVFQMFTIRQFSRSLQQFFAMVNGASDALTIRSVAVGELNPN